MRKTLLFICLFCIGCSTQPKTTAVHISLVNNNQSLKFQGLEGAVLGEIQRDSSLAAWQSLAPVYRLPADTDLKNLQHPQPGAYRVLNGAVIFTPDTPFTKGQTYYLRFYHFGEGKSISEMVRNKTTLGSQPYTDFNFGY